MRALIGLLAMAVTQATFGQEAVTIPPELAVGADYALTVIAGARPDAERLAQFVLSSNGQVILVRHGFTAIQTEESK